MGSRQKDGSTLKEHIEAAESNPFAAFVPKAEEALAQVEEPPSLPEPAMYAWTYFVRLHNTRQPGGLGGFCAITFQEIEAFINVTYSDIEPWEIDLIQAWDREFLKIVAEQQERESKKNSK